ncbi:MAG: guanylate kinase [Gammaproteobacteria bacterium]|nr:guanylate kinase [Gammaproteobacteria bacterium]
MRDTQSGQIFVITAPSGTGKTTLTRDLRNTVDGLGVCISHTTRTPREGEVNGESYHFVDQTTFDAMVSNGEFLEYAPNYGNAYGTSLAAAQVVLDQGLDLVLEIDWQGAQQIKALRPDAIWILIVPPSMETLRQRLESRQTETAATLKTRIEAAQTEIDEAKAADYLIVNDDLDTAKQALRSVVTANRLRFARMIGTKPSIAALFSA